MVIHAYNHTRLMDESEARVEMSVICASPADPLVASRILGRPRAYRRWEAEHDRLMRSVSRQTNVDRQVTALRSTALSLVHRKAMFDYLRDREFTGRKLHRFFSLFYGSRDYVNPMLPEPTSYLPFDSSYLCTTYLAA